MAQRLAKDMNQPPIPLTHKALGKRLAESDYFVQVERTEMFLASASKVRSRMCSTSSSMIS